MEITIFGLKLTLDPVAFTIPLGSNHWDVYWYGIIIALGFLLALIYGYTNAKRFGINTDRMLDVVIVTVPVAILCARAYYVIFDGEKLTSIGDFFGFSSSGFSGLAIYGGVIGAFLTGALMCKLRKIHILDMFDLAAIGFLIGQGIGRWGNFVNQEAFGTFTGSSWWGMESANTIAVMGEEGLVHPCFLYESVWCLLGVLVLHLISKKRKFSGQIILCYCVWYGLERGFLELIRTDSLMWGRIRVSSLLSFTLCIGAAILLTVMLCKKRKVAKEGVYDNMFADPEFDSITEETESVAEITEENTEENANIPENTGETENDKNN